MFPTCGVKSPIFRETRLLRALDVLPDPVPGCARVIPLGLDAWTVPTASTDAHGLQEASASLSVGIVANAKGWMV